MTLWLYDHLASWAERAGEFVSAPFRRVSGWAGRKWWDAQ